MVQGWSSVLQQPAACSRTLVLSNPHFSRCSAAAEAARVLSLQNTPIDLQSLKLIDFHLLRWSAQQRLFTVLGALMRGFARADSLQQRVLWWSLS